jgi:hypothetical protein
MLLSTFSEVVINYSLLRFGLVKKNFSKSHVGSEEVNESKYGNSCNSARELVYFACSHSCFFEQQKEY